MATRPTMLVVLTSVIAVRAAAAAPSEAAVGPVTAPLSLASLLARAVATHPLLAAAGHDVAAAEAERQAMSGKLYPTLSALVLVGPTPAAHGDPQTTTTPVDDYGYLLEHLGPFFRAELGVTQPLYTFGKVSAAEQALAALVGVRQARVTTAKWEVVTQVKAVYYGVLFVDELLALTREVQGWVDQAKGYLEEHLANDEADVAPIDRAKLTTYDAELKTQRLELDKRAAVLRDALARLVGLDPDGDWLLGGEGLAQVTAPELSVTELQEIASELHPELGAATAGVRALGAKREALRASYWPDLFVAGRARYGLAPNRDRQASPFAKDEFNFLDAGIAVGLRYDWATGVAAAEVAEASAELAALAEKRRALAERVAHELRAAAGEVTTGRDKIEASKEGFKAARVWAAFANNGFELGTVSAKELIDALGAFVKARFALLELIYEYNMAVARLSQATGKELMSELAAGVW